MIVDELRVTYGVVPTKAADVTSTSICTCIAAIPWTCASHEDVEDHASSLVAENFHELTPGIGAEDKE